MTKRVFSAITQVLPDDDDGDGDGDGDAYLTRVDIRRGWGNVLNVRLHTTTPHTEAGREFGEKLRGAIEHALGDERHLVEIVWGSDS
jgi:hypothetical protein